MLVCLRHGKAKFQKFFTILKCLNAESELLQQQAFNVIEGERGES